MKLVYSWPADKRISSGYGWRIHPKTGKRAFHRGLDITGTYPVTAAGDGVVHSAGFNAKGGGHWVKIDHGSRTYSVYYHGREATQLRKGDRVFTGDFIYTAGNTGSSVRPHLHFEIRKNNAAWGFDVDPVPYLEGPGTGAGSKPAPLSGRLDRDTIRKWQEVLKRDHGYRGRIDGLTGSMTWTAVQNSLRPHGYTGKIDGIAGRMTYTALQRKLGRPETGRLNADDIRALQATLNAGTY